MRPLFLALPACLATLLLFPAIGPSAQEGAGSARIDLILPQPRADAPGGTKTTTIAVVLPEAPTVILGRVTVSGSITTHPSVYEELPGLRVEVLGEFDLPVDSEGQPSLEGVLVDTGNGPPRPALEGFTLVLRERGPEPAPKLPPGLAEQLELGFDDGVLNDRVTADFTYYARLTRHADVARDPPLPDQTARFEESPFAIRVRLADVGAEILDELIERNKRAWREVPLPAYEALDIRVPTAEEFEAPSLCPTGGVVQIDGPFDGRRASTAVRFDDVPARIIAESGDALFVEAPADLPTGPHRITVQESLPGGQVAIDFPIVTSQLRMSADQTTLLKGQRTAFTVTISGPEALPESVWEQGTLELILDRRQSNIIMRDEVDGQIRRTLGRSDFWNRPYRYKGEIQSLSAGAFSIFGTLTPNFPRVKGTPHQK